TRSRLVREGLALVAELEDPVAREEYARQLAGRLGESENAVMLELERRLAGQPTASPAGAAKAPQRARVPDEEVEWEVLKLLIQAPDLCAQWMPKLHAEQFGKPTHRKAFEVILEPTSDGGAKGVSALIARAQAGHGEQVARLLAGLAVERPKSEAEPTADYVQQLFLRL